MQRSRRQAVFVSGAPGAGKTSLAVPLAAELGFALVSKDRIKETLHDALGAPEPDLAWSRTLGAAAMELLWALAADAPSVVVEANFRPRDPYQRGKLAALADDPVEVYCRCDPALAARRYRDRARTSHPVHVVTGLTPEMLAEYGRPVGIGELITVDTAAPVDAAAVAAAVRARLRGPAALWCGHAGGPMAFVIRDAVPGDVAVLADVFRRASLSNQGDRTALLANPEVLEFPGLGGDDRRTRVAVAADGRVAGFATSVPAGNVIELDDLFVDPDWMRQGAGRALVLDAAAIARNLGAGRIEVTANRHALAFYHQAGFAADHEVQTRFGRGLRMHLDVTA